MWWTRAFCGKIHAVGCGDTCRSRCAASKDCIRDAEQFEETPEWQLQSKIRTKYHHKATDLKNQPHNGKVLMNQWQAGQDFTQDSSCGQVLMKQDRPAGIEPKQQLEAEQVTVNQDQQVQQNFMQKL